MKKIIALFVFVLGISFSASAQENTETIRTEAKEQVKTLQKYLGLNGKKTKEIYDVLIEKNALIINPTTAKRNITSNEVDTKLRELLSKEEYIKLLENKDLHTKLMN